MTLPTFQAAFPYVDDVLGLPVEDLDAASAWYGGHFSMKEVERREHPAPAVILERDGVQLGFAINGGDPEQEGAAVLVTHLLELKKEFESKGLEIGEPRIDERGGKKFQVFFVVAPDGLCYYFHEPLPDSESV